MKNTKKKSIALIPVYRLGTIVFHCDNKKMGCEKDIVDGQQRLITLSLIINALSDADALNDILQKKIQSIRKNKNYHFFFSENKFLNPVSHLNIKQNDNAIRGEIDALISSEQLNNWVEILLNRCELVWFEIPDLAECFQFFDSQNSRGMPLLPHDLLKAYHLREIGFDCKVDFKEETVKTWERYPSKNENKELGLHDLFANYLYPVHCWSRNKENTGFDSQDINWFKGIKYSASIHSDTEKRFPYPWAHMLYLSYRQSLENNTPRTFCLDYPVVAGRDFFHMVGHYYKKINLINYFLERDRPDWLFIPESGTGDRYVMLMFKTLFFCYTDRFVYDMKDFTRNKHHALALEIIYRWSYSLRLQKKRVAKSSIEKYIRENNIFSFLRDTVSPSDFLQYTIPTVRDTSNSSENKSELYIHFKKNKWLITKGQ